MYKELTTEDLEEQYNNNLDNDSILERVALNYKTPKQILSKLSIHDEKKIRRAVAANKSTPDEVLELLSQDDSETVRFGLLFNQELETTSKAFQNLLNDESEKIRNFAIKILQKGGKGK